MNMEKKRQIEELYILKNRHNNYPKGFDYENNISENSFSGFMFFNNRMKEFIVGLNKPLYHFFDSNHIVRNWKNWYVSKYYKDHIK